MAVMKMKRICVCALRKNRKQILEGLQSMGTIELEFGDAHGLELYDTSSKRGVFERNAQNIDTALAVLDEYAPKSGSILDSLAGRSSVDKNAYDEIVKDSLKLVDDAGKIIHLRDLITESKAEIANLNSNIEAITPWLGADVSLGLKKTKTSDVIFGVMPSSVSDEELEELLHNFSSAFETVSRDKNSAYVMIVTKRSDTEAVNNVLRKHGFSHPPKLCNGFPAREREAMLGKISELNRTIDKAISDIKGYAPKRKALMTASDYYRMRADKYEVIGKIPQSKHAFFLNGFVPEKYADMIAKVLEERFSAAVELKDTDDAPVELENNGFAESFEGVLESFGLPKKGEFDPSFIMSIFYVFLFGLMLSDAAYGAIISVSCFALIKKFKNMESSLRKSIKMFMYCGLSTLFWGIMFGGYFGDALEVIARTFFNKEITVPALWFVPLKDPMRLLMYSLLFGLIHLFTGLALKGYMYIRDKDYKGFVFDILSWFMLLGGLIALLLKSSIFESLSGNALNLGRAGNIIASAFAAVGALIILFTSGRTSKNFGIRLAKGAYSLYDITSWLSDVLSYSRLLALGLATGVIASVINQMGTMAGNGVMGTIIFIAVFIFGHIFNLAINLLSAYVHTNRLQYVEFFGKFYEGGGRKFNPFKENTKYIKVTKNNL